MNSVELVLDWQLIGVTLFALLMFGIAYNALIERMGEAKDGYTALLVAFGVLVTLGGVAIVNWQSAVLTVAMFVASGTPMIVGDIVRSILRRRSAIQAMRDRHEQA